MRYTLFALSLLILAGCGSSDKPETPLQAGYYLGSGSVDGAEVTMRSMVSASGKIVLTFFPADTNSTKPYGFGHYHAETLAGDFTASGDSGVIFADGTSHWDTSEIVASDNSGNFSGIMTFDNPTTGHDFDLQRNPISDFEYSPSEANGHYSSSSASFDLMVNDGQINGQVDFTLENDMGTYSCPYSGTMTPEQDVNLYQIEFNFDSSLDTECASYDTLVGLGYLNLTYPEPGLRLMIMTESGDLWMSRWLNKI